MPRPAMRAAASPLRPSGIHTNDETRQPLPATSSEPELPELAELALREPPARPQLSGRCAHRWPATMVTAWPRRTGTRRARVREHASRTCSLPVAGCAREVCSRPRSNLALAPADGLWEIPVAPLAPSIPQELPYWAQQQQMQYEQQYAPPQRSNSIFGGGGYPWAPTPPRYPAAMPPAPHGADLDDSFRPRPMYNTEL